MDAWERSLKRYEANGEDEAYVCEVAWKLVCVEVMMKELNGGYGADLGCLGVGPIEAFDDG